MPDLYIYYRVDPTQIDAWLPALRDLQGGLAARFGVRARLARKCGDATMMEIYEAVRDPEAFLGDLAAELERLGFERLLAPGASRHVERFECV